MRKRLLLLALLATLALLAPGGSLRLSPIQQAALPYQWQIAQWEVANAGGKWWHLLVGSMEGSSTPRSQRLQQVQEFFRLGEEERRLVHQRLRLSAQGHPPSLAQAEEALSQVRKARAKLRPGVEETLEGELSSVLRQQGLVLDLAFLKLQLPPVDIRFEAPPLILITSPRDRVQRLSPDQLLQPTMTVAEMEGLEQRILADQNLSALVEGIGGISTYPAAIPDGYDLRTTLHLMAHEWLHHYLFFHPLGQAYGRDMNLLTLNETVADLAGRELGDLVFVRLGGSLPPPAPPAGQSPNAQDETHPQGFRFEREMRQTRLEVDRLLGEGKVAEAEAYMEVRRQLFVEHGIAIRKLNQAYFAYHGSYGDSPASVSPVGGEAATLRATFASVGPFVEAVAAVSSYEAFQALLRERSGLP